MPERVKAKEPSERIDAKIPHNWLRMGRRGLLDVSPPLNNCSLHRFRPGADKGLFSLGLDTADGSTGSRGKL